MTAAALPISGRRLDGGRPARRAVIRWAWRLFRREWNRQVLVLSLLAVAVAATTVGLGVVANVATLKADPVFGTADTILSLPGSDRLLAADVATLQARYHPSDVVYHSSIPIPGSVSSLDIRAEDPSGTYVKPTLRLRSGRFPSGAGQVALTPNAASTLGLSVGDTWVAAGRSRTVVGLVENPLNLLDDFALVGPGQLSKPDRVSVLVDTGNVPPHGLGLAGGTGIDVSGRGTGGKTGPEVLVLVLGTIALLFVGLVAVAGFTVMAQRRLRALGMLESIGATSRHVRLVLIANGAVVGTTAAIVGTVAGLAGWVAFAPTLQRLVSHRVDALNLPWWGVAAAIVLSIVTAVLAAWWPARAVVRIPVVAALSGRPPRPQAAHRFAVVGALLLATGLVLLAFADQNRAGFIIAGTLTTGIALPFLAPLAIRALGGVAGRASVAVRLAWRDLSRYQARSGAALGAITLAIGIAATIAISAAAAQTPGVAGNLPRNQLVAYVAQGGLGNPIPPLSTGQLAVAQAKAAAIAKAIGAATPLQLEQAYDPHAGLQQGPPGSGTQSGYVTATLAHVTRFANGGMEITTMLTLYVATPAVLAHYGIAPASIDPKADVITSRHDLGGLQIFSPGPAGPKGEPTATHPVVQVISGLPGYTSAPSLLITPHALQTLGYQTLTTGWFLQTPQPLTVAQILTARRAAAPAGLYIEVHRTSQSLDQLRYWATLAGVFLALGVLAMTVGLIRSETGRDLRTLTAAGASSRTRRALTAATSGTLALLGALLGVAGAYAALLCWHRSDLHPLAQVPTANLLMLLVGLPLLGAAGGWLLAGREPSGMARQPLD